MGLVILATSWATTPQIFDRMELKHRVETKALEDIEVVYKFDRTLGKGRVKKVDYGDPGVMEITYSQLLVDGVLKSEKELSRVEVGAKPAVYLMGTQGYSAGRSGTLTRAKIAEMESTAYTPDAGRGARATFRTATGRRAEYGIVAVDPDVIPMNTLLFVEGYGFAVAADTGGAIKGNKIDVCVPTYSEARQWGRRTVRVHIFRQKLEADKSESE